ncbi:MAG: ATP synthase F1 subunit gamma [Bacteroidota bacterium]
MANLKEVRARIKSVQTTQQITKAMKLVSASKLKRATDRITQMRPYADKLYTILGNILVSVEGEDMSLNFNQERPVKKVALVVITASKGLCGGFNSNILKKAKSLAFGEYNEYRLQGNLTIFCIGKKSFDFFKNLKVDINTDYLELLNQLNFDKSATFTEMLMTKFLTNEYDRIDCVYSQFKNAATQIYTAERFLPIAKLETTGVTSTTNADYIFDPSKTQLIEELVPKIIKTQFFRYLLDSNASEHGARMVAMDSATSNANDLLNSLKILYNRERQASITKELGEIVGGAAALDNA